MFFPQSIFTLDMMFTERNWFTLQRFRFVPGNVNSKSSSSGLLPLAEALIFCLFVVPPPRDKAGNAAKCRESPELDDGSPALFNLTKKTHV